MSAAGHRTMGASSVRRTPAGGGPGWGFGVAGTGWPRCLTLVLVFRHSPHAWATILRVPGFLASAEDVPADAVSGPVLAPELELDAGRAGRMGRKLALLLIAVRRMCSSWGFGVPRGQSPARADSTPPKVPRRLSPPRLAVLAWAPARWRPRLMTSLRTAVTPGAFTLYCHHNWDGPGSRASRAPGFIALLPLDVASNATGLAHRKCYAALPNPLETAGPGFVTLRCGFDECRQLGVPSFMRKIYACPNAISSGYPSPFSCSSSCPWAG